MKKISKTLLGLIVIFSITFSTICIPAYADWQQSDGKWTYTNSDGNLKTGWFQDGSNWYYFNKKGIMITGWISENNTWYYMRENGSLNNFKTTNAIPNEIQSIFNVVAPFASGLNLKYAGMGYVKYTDAFSNYGLANKYVVILKSSNEYGDSPDFYYVYDPYNCKVFKLYDNLTIEYLGQGNRNDLISKDQATQEIKTYLEDNKIDIPNLTLNIADEKNNSYFILCQEINVDHVNTVEAYYIDKTTGLIIPRG